MRGRVREVVERHAASHGLPIEAVVGPKRRRKKAAVAARHAAIVELWDRSTHGDMGVRSEFRWSLSAVARALGMDHASVRYGLIKAGVYSPPGLEAAE